METLTHVLWIGGPPGSGKTTVAKRISRRHGLRWYNADAHTWEHRDRALRAGHPAALRWEAMTPEERWTRSTPAEMLEMSLHSERPAMIADDLRALPTSPLIVAEGATVMPFLVASGAADRARAVWLLPTPAFRHARLEERELPSGPAQLYARLAVEIEREAEACAVRVVRVEESFTPEDTVAAVEELFAEALTAGPCAEGTTERRALLRYANEAVVSQCMGYLARPWTTGDPETFVRAFLCECDDPECTAVLELPVAAFVRAARAAGPVLAPGHGRG